MMAQLLSIRVSDRHPIAELREILRDRSIFYTRHLAFCSRNDAIEAQR